MVQWLRLCTFSAKNLGLISGWGTKIPQSSWHNQKKKRERERETKSSCFEILKKKKKKKLTNLWSGSPRRKERTRINKIRNEKRETSTHSIEVQKNLKRNLQLYANTFDNLKETDNFLETFSPPKWTKKKQFEQTTH